MNDRRLLLRMCALFVLFGAYIGSLAVSVTDIEHTLGASHATIGALLAIALACGGVLSALVSVRAHKHGAGETLRIVLLAWSLSLLVAVAVPANWTMAVLFVLTMAGAATVDVLMNTIATVAVSGSTTLLLRLHATYCLGAALGAIAGAGLIEHGFDFRLTWLGIAALVLAWTVWSWRSLAVGEGSDEESDDVPLNAALSSLLRDRLIIVAAAFVLGAIVEGGIDAWGPLYLRTELNSGALGGGGAAAFGYLIGFCSRLSLSTLSDRLGAKYCSVLGSGVAACGLLLLVTADSVLPAAVGLALAVGGITTNWPVLISYATQNNAHAALITGGLSTAGYAGLVIGPAVLGSVASFVSLHLSLVILASFAAIVTLLVVSIPRVHSPAVRA